MRHTPRSSLERLIPRTSLDHDDIERMRKAAWHKQGVLNVMPSDHRLTWPERELIKQIGEKLYGCTKEDSA